MDRNAGNPILVVALLVIGVLVLLSLVAVPAMGMMGGIGMMGGLASGGSGGYSWGWLMMLFLVLFIVGIALIVFWLFRQGYITGTGDRDGDGTHSEKGIGGQSALNILKQRYARGEIAKEQYDQIKLDIETD